jgi:hypothetical protein
MKNIRLLIPLVLSVAYYAPYAEQDPDAGEQPADTTVTAPSSDSSPAIAATGQDTLEDDIAETAPVPHTKKPRRCRKCPPHDSDILIVRETADTVFIFNKKTFKNFARDWRNNIDTFRKQSIGLSGTSGYGMNAIAMQPIEDFLDNHPGFSGKRFRGISRFGFEPYVMSGGSGVIGLGEGFRLGGGGMSGERRFFSDPFHDSILVLNTRVSYGGFLVEKATVKGKWNFTYGGTIGGGTLKLVVSEKNDLDWFSTSTDMSNGIYQEDDIFKNSGYEAAYFLLEPHWGCSYTLFTFFHIGTGISLPTFMSLDATFPYTDDFITVNPAIQLKLIFGNLG